MKYEYVSNIKVNKILSIANSVLWIYWEHLCSRLGD